MATLAVCLALAVPACADDALRMIPVFRHGTAFYAPHHGVAADLDGDGGNELVLCEGSGPLSLGRRDGGAYAVEWKGAPVGCQAMVVGDRDRDGGLELAVVYQNQLMIFDPRGLGGPVVAITLPGIAADVALGNVDGDGAREIVVTSYENNATWVYDAETLEIQWTATGYGGSTVRIADVDGNSLPEIVVNGSTASVLDAAAEVQKWGYVGGFGYNWDTGNVDADAKEEIVFYSGGTMTVLSGDTFGTVSWPGPGNNYYALSVEDGDGDGANEIVAARGLLVGGYRPSDGVELWAIEMPGYGYSVNSLVVANLDGDSGREVAAIFSSSDSAVAVVDKATNTLEWQSIDSQGPFRIAAGDLDGDGRSENVISTRSAETGRGKIEIFDAATNTLKSTIHVTEPGYYGYIENLAIAQADADPALEIVAIVYQYPMALVSWDGATGAREFTSNTGAVSLLSTLTVANIDGDALDELIVGTDDSKLLILNGASNFVQKSLQLTSDLMDAAVADLDGDSDLELVTASYYDNLTVYDTNSWATLGSATLWNLFDIDATAAGGGTVVATSHYYGLTVFKGAALTSEYSCSNTNSQVAVFGEIAGETRLIAARSGRLVVLPLTGPCPDPLAETLTALSVTRLQIADGTGDGRNDLLVSAANGAHVALLGLSSEMRGDVDGDELVTSDDVDAVTDYLLGGVPGISPSCDANADNRAGIEDLFRLIDHEFGSGTELQP
ncbi:MAG TPA: FG-GAP-like repeat-containing protein [Thermoanaerobaculia bacterium]|jgi:hypothetical protein